MVRTSTAWRWSSGDADDGRAFLQSRVRLFVRVLAAFFAAFTVGGVVKTLVLRTHPGPVATFGDPATQVQTALASTVACLLVTVGLALETWVLAKPRTSRWLSIYEWTGAFVGSAAMVQLVHLLPEGAPTAMIVFPVMLIMVLRAGLVPSRALPSGVLAVGIAVTVGVTLYWSARDDAMGWRRYDWLMGSVWVLAFGAATAVVSHVIYGLQQEVRRARNLGNYTLDQKLGEGGMGEVYLAHHAFLKRPTAIKLLPPEKLGEQAIARFEREVKELSRLSHPNTVAIFDFGRTPQGIFYYAMEYLDGLDLDELVELDGPQPASRVIHVLAQVAHALAEAHDEGLIHRDIKPANVVLCHRGGVPDLAKVVDFGLVKDLKTPSPHLSTSDVITGTPQFMAPESLTRPDQIDGRTDLYALGAVGYFLLTGEHVFEGKTLVEICSHHLHTPPEPPSARRADVPADLEAVLLRCLEKDAAARFGHARDLRRALLACSAAGDWREVEAEAWWRTHADAIEQQRSSHRDSSSPDELAERLVARAYSGPSPRTSAP